MGWMRNWVISKVVRVTINDECIAKDLLLHGLGVVLKIALWKGKLEKARAVERVKKSLGHWGIGVRSCNSTSGFPRKYRLPVSRLQFGSRSISYI